MRIFFFKLNIILLSLVILSGESYGETIDVTSKFYVAKSVAEGQNTISLMIATHDNKHNDFINFLKIKNIDIQFESSDLGYVRVITPVNKIHEIIKTGMAKTVNVEAEYPPLYHSDQEQYTSVEKISRRSLKELIDDPSSEGDLLDFEAMGLVTLRKSHPHADGRGVTIAHIESFIDPETPEMGQAKLLDGRAVPKVRAIYEANSYMAEKFPHASSRPLRNGVQMTRVATEENSTVRVAGEDIRMPGNGQYWVANINELNHPMASRDFNKDGNPASTPRTFAIARKEGEDCFRVDVNQNRDLTDDACLGDFNASRHTSRFPSASSDELGTRFYILTTPQPDWIVFATPDVHSHFVANSALGAPAFDPRVSGAAPGAQIIHIAPSNVGTSAFLEAFIRAAYDPQVDIIFVSASIMVIQQGGQEVHNVVLDRIVERKNKIIIVAAGNRGNMFSSVNPLSDSKNVISVGQFNSKKVKRSFFGILEPDSSHMASAGGPTIDGRIKPDIIAPSFMVLANPDSSNHKEERTDSACPHIAMPPRATCGGGTSNAAPVAAGAVASLLSVLKKDNKAVNALDIVNSIRFAARHVSTIPVYLQGHGVIDVPATLKLLSSRAQSRPTFFIEAPVPQGLTIATGKTIRGQGLFEREGWHPGSAGSRIIRITRTTGPRNTSTFTAQFIGDSQNTYSAPSRLELPLNKSVVVPITITPQRPGVHSAILELRSAENAEIAERINLVTIAAIPLSSLKDHTLSFKVKGSVTRPPIFYVDVPENTAALGFEVELPDVPLGQFPLRGPMAGVEALTETTGKLDPAALSDLPFADRVQRAIMRPAPGVWQFALSYKAIHNQIVDFSGRIFIVTDQEAEEVMSRATKKNVGYTTAATNQDALHVRPIAGFYKAGSVEHSERVIPSLVPFTVPAGASQVEIRVRSSGPVAAALLECVTGACQFIDSTIGRETVGLARAVSENSKLYVVIAPLAKIVHNINIGYEIYFPHIEASNRNRITYAVKPNDYTYLKKNNNSHYKSCMLYAVYKDDFRKSIVIRGAKKSTYAPSKSGISIASNYNILLNKNFNGCESH